MKRDDVRSQWSSKGSFFFAAVGSAVGLGVLWKLPYIVKNNGGGIFMLFYLICMILVGVPLLLGEILLGSVTKFSSVRCFKSINRGSAFWDIAGWLGMIISLLVLSFYSVVGGWGFSYLLSSLFKVFDGLSPLNVADIFTTLERSVLLNMIWHTAFILTNMLVVISGVKSGIEYCSRFMIQGLFVLLLILALYVCTLPGFTDALYFVFYPNLDNFRVSSIIEALGLVLFTLSLGQGVMVSYGSYIGNRKHIVGVIVAIPLTIVLVAMLASTTIFSVVYSFGLQGTFGHGLIFQTLPYLFSQLVGGHLLSCIFFLIFVFAALTSSMAMLEVVSTNLVDIYGISRNKAVLAATAVSFICGIPSASGYSTFVFGNWLKIYGFTFMDTLNNLVSDWVIPIEALIITLFVGWVWPKDPSYDSVIVSRPWQYWHCFMKWVVPTLIVLIILQKTGIFFQ